MRKCYFYAMHNHNGHQTLYRFRTKKDREAWAGIDQGKDVPFYESEAIHFVDGLNPEVRRINRMIKAGEAVAFPVEID